MRFAEVFFSFFAAPRTAFGLVLQPAFDIKFLLAGSPGEAFATVCTAERLVGESHF